MFKLFLEETEERQWEKAKIKGTLFKCIDHANDSDMAVYIKNKTRKTELEISAHPARSSP